MYGTNYFRREKGGSPNDEKVPIRWMAPESIEEDIYTEATDVVSIKGSITIHTLSVKSHMMHAYKRSSRISSLKPWYQNALKGQYLCNNGYIY